VQFNLNIDYTTRDEDRAGYFATNRNITEALIRAAIAAKTGGNDAPKARDTGFRILARIERALFAAVKAKHDTVDLTKEQVEEIQKALESWQVPTGNRAWVADLLDYVESLLKSTPKE
jgi:hypothetical protein